MKNLISATGIVTVALFISIAQTAAHADNFCSAIASHLRAGEADGPAHTVIDTLASKDRPVIQLADDDTAVSQILEGIHATPKLMQAAKSQFGDNFDGASVNWLGKSGAGAIKAQVGTANCTEMMFFDTHDGQTDEIAPPEGMGFGEASVCWNSTASIGTSGAIPILIEEDDRNTGALANADLTVVPWQGHHWGPTCQINATFATSLEVTGASCQKGVDCGSTQNEALRLAEREDANASDSEAADDNTGKVPQHLGDLASNAPELDRIPVFKRSSLSPYWRTFASRRLIPLHDIQGESLAVIGPGFWGCCEEPGYLIGIWRIANDVLKPLASFQIVRQRGKIASVKIEQP